MTRVTLLEWQALVDRYDTESSLLKLKNLCSVLYPVTFQQVKSWSGKEQPPTHVNVTIAPYGIQVDSSPIVSLEGLVHVHLDADRQLLSLLFYSGPDQIFQYVFTSPHCLTMDATLRRLKRCSTFSSLVFHSNNSYLQPTIHFEDNEMFVRVMIQSGTKVSRDAIHECLESLMKRAKEYIENGMKPSPSTESLPSPPAMPPPEIPLSMEKMSASDCTYYANRMHRISSGENIKPLNILKPSKPAPPPPPRPLTPSPAASAIATRPVTKREESQKSNLSVTTPFFTPTSTTFQDSPIARVSHRNTPSHDSGIVRSSSPTPSAKSSATHLTVESGLSVVPSADITSDTLEHRDPVTGELKLILKREQGNLQIVAGTRDALTDHLMHGGATDSEFTNAFLLTFRHFIKPLDLIRALRTKFQQAEPLTKEMAVEEERKAEFLGKLRKVNVLKKWVERSFPDFEDAETRQELDQFLGELGSLGYKHFVAQMYARLDKTARLTSATTDLAPSLPLPAEALLSTFEILGIKPERLAQHLTLSDVEVMRHVSPDILAWHLWARPVRADDPVTAPLRQYIERFNQVGFWVASVVCHYNDLKQRHEALKLMIKCAKCLMSHRDFNSAFAVMSGLGMTPVSRLKKTWAMLSAKHLNLYKQLEQQCNPECNFRAYRELEQQSKMPIIPFFGLYMKDLTFMNDGNRIEWDDGLINFDKARMIVQKMMNWQRFLEVKFAFDILSSPGAAQTEELQLARYCRALPHFDEQQLYMKSKMWEPPAVQGQTGTLRRGESIKKMSMALNGG